MANASDDTLASATQTSTPRTLFKSTRAGGSDIDGATAISVLNTGGTDAFLWSRGHHGSSAGSTGYMRVPAGTSLTVRVTGDSNASVQIDELIAKTASGSTTLSWGVTERR